DYSCASIRCCYRNTGETGAFGIRNRPTQRGITGLSKCEGGENQIHEKQGYGKNSSHVHHPRGGECYHRSSYNQRGQTISDRRPAWPCHMDNRLGGMSARRCSSQTRNSKEITDRAGGLKRTISRMLR